MWRYLAGAGAGALLVAAGMMLQAMRPAPVAPLAAMPAALAATASDEGQAVAEPVVPEATAKTREEKRFNRYDKDRDGAITRDEYLASRRKAFAKLDKNANGVLSFDEWAVKSETKFAIADADKSGAMNAREFATTAVKRKARAKVRCPDKPTPAAAEESRTEES